MRGGTASWSPITFRRSRFAGLVRHEAPNPARRRAREGSFCQTGGCSSHCADGPAPVAPLTVVRAATPVRLDFSAGDEVTKIHGDIWAGESLSGQPIESFDLGNGARAYTSKAMAAGRYYMLVSLQWSRPLDSGDTGLAFHVEIVPP
ncbi:MAG: hypothetical protein E6I18_09065 [Chloroflexi bacterium]|nr:MAG: hypothetical protein E6I18_09065 [Chloroflexota bacterium]